MSPKVARGRSFRVEMTKVSVQGFFRNFEIYFKDWLLLLKTVKF